MVIYYEISFSYTLQCNAFCDHCCVNASPNIKMKIGLEDAKACIIDAKKYGIKFIAFTGGEVTLHQDELFNILTFSKNKHIKNILVSNGQWATDKKKATDFVKELKKRDVVEIQISTDMFHAEYIPFDYVLNAIIAIKQEQIKPVVMLARIKNDKETESLKDVLLKTGVEIIEQPVVPFSGRSQKINPKLLYHIPLVNMKHIGCISVLSPTISPYKKVYACCASDFSILNGSSLFLGDLAKISLCEILHNQQNNKIIDALYLWGPKFLYDLVKKEKASLLHGFPQKYYGYCDLCYRLLKDRYIVGILKEKMQDKDLLRKIEISKMVKHEKIRNMPDKTNLWYECVIEREEA